MRADNPALVPQNAMQRMPQERCRNDPEIEPEMKKARSLTGLFRYCKFWLPDRALLRTAIIRFELPECWARKAA